MDSGEAQLRRLEKMIAELRKLRETTQLERLRAAALREQAHEIGVESEQARERARELITELNELIANPARGKSSRK